MIAEEFIYYQVKDLTKKCQEERTYRTVEGYVGPNSEFRLMLRWSKLEWDEHNKTIDVVQIGWMPFLMGLVEDLETKPKRSARFVWDALERCAKECGRVLRVECVLIDTLRQYLIKERGYTPQKGDAHSLLCLKDVNNK